MHRLKFIILIAFITLYSCEKKISESQFEQNVFDEIFLKVVDSTYKDKRLYTCFPEQGEIIHDKNGKWIGRDTTGQHQRDLDREVKRAFLAKDTLNLIIAVKNYGLINDKTNLEKYKSSKFIFRNFSELPEERYTDYKNWTLKYNKFAGSMSFSNIKFDEKKQNGLLNVYYSCGGKCGLGYLVSIKKTKDIWVISSVEQTSIS